MKLSCVFLGSSSACAVYSFQMVSALLFRGDCDLQVIISKRVYNLEEWKNLCENKRCELVIIDTYSHNIIQAGLSFLNIWNIKRLANRILQFSPKCVYFPFGCVWSPILFPMLYKKVTIIDTIHDPHQHDKFKNFAERLRVLSNRWAKKFVTGIVILNELDRKYIEERYHKAVTVIPHAAFSYYAKGHKLLDFDSITRTILFIGRIEPYKGLDLLVDAFEKLHISDLKLVIAGSGKIEEELKSRILSNTSITLHNRFIPDDELVNFVEKSDFLVLPYKRASQSGVIPLSFALGRTVIATNVGALQQQVPKGTGLIVDATADRIAEAVNYLYNNPALIIEYNSSAKKYAEKELTWTKSAENLICFCESFS